MKIQKKSRRIKTKEKVKSNKDRTTDRTRQRKENLLELPNIAQLNIIHAIILVLVSVARKLTLSKMTSKKTNRNTSNRIGEKIWKNL